MIIRVERLEDVSYRKRVPSIIENSCNSKLRYLNSKIKRSQQEADSVWDSFSETELHESVIESIYQGRKKVVDDLCAQRDIVNDIKLNNIVYFSLLPVYFKS